MSDRDSDTQSQGRTSMSSSAATTARHDSVLDLDMVDRDPNDMNDYLKTMFEDVIAEPDGGHSKDCIWRNSYKCFYAGKNCCYTCLTYLCAVPLAFCWGCNFACVMFAHIWSVTPCLRCFDINFKCFQRVWSTCVHCMYDACYESCALMFTKIHVTMANE